MYLIKPENANRLMQVWCDQRHDPGGWTVIQRRQDGSVNFFRNWDTYKVKVAVFCRTADSRFDAQIEQAVKIAFLSEGLNQDKLKGTQHSSARTRQQGELLPFREDRK